MLARGFATEMFAVVRPHNPGLRHFALLDLPHDGAFVFNAACRTDTLEPTLDHCVRADAYRARLLTFGVVDSATAKVLVAVRFERFFIGLSRDSCPNGHAALVLLADWCERVEADVIAFGCGLCSLLTVAGIDLLAVADRCGSVWEHLNGFCLSLFFLVWPRICSLPKFSMFSPSLVSTAMVWQTF